jgi:Erythromycin esterase
MPRPSTSPLTPTRHWTTWPHEAIVGDADVVGLGQSNGSHDQFTVKQRMVRLLVERAGFRTVAFEDDFASGVSIDRHVVTGEGDPLALVGATSSPLWATEEMLDQGAWTRDLNLAHPDNPVDFSARRALQSGQVSPSAVPVDDQHVGLSEGDRPAGVIEGDRERPAAMPVDMRHAVALAVVVDDVAGSQLVGVDRGHRPPPSIGAYEHL